MNGQIAWLDTKGYKFGLAPGPRIRADLANVVRRFALLIEARIKESMAAPKHGRLATGPGGRVYRASAPGEAPAIRTGRLHSAVRIKTYGFGMEAEIGVFSDGPVYAAELEKGLGNLAARPYVVPAFREFELAFVRSVHLVVASLGLGGKSGEE